MGDIIILAGGTNHASYATAPSHHPKSSILLNSDNTKLNSVNSTGSMSSQAGQLFGRVH